MDEDLEALRARWLELMRVRLPEAARYHSDWPIRLDHCFGRVILDAVCDRPWHEAISAPAWRHLSEDQLHQAIALAEAILSGEADLHALNVRSLDARRLSRAHARSRPRPDAPA